MYNFCLKISKQDILPCLPIDCKQIQQQHRPRCADTRLFSYWSMVVKHQVWLYPCPPKHKSRTKTNEWNSSIRNAMHKYLASSFTRWLRQSPNFICFSNFFSLSLNRVSCCWFVPCGMTNKQKRRKVKIHRNQDKTLLW